MSATYQPKRQPCPPDIAKRAQERGPSFVEAMIEREAIMWDGCGRPSDRHFWVEAYASTVEAVRLRRG